MKISCTAVSWLLLLLSGCILSRPVDEAQVYQNGMAGKDMGKISPSKPPEILSAVPEYLKAQYNLPNKVPEYSNTQYSLPSEIPEYSNTQYNLPSEIPEYQNTQYNLPREMPEYSNGRYNIQSEVPEYTNTLYNLPIKVQEYSNTWYNPAFSGEPEGMASQYQPGERGRQPWSSMIQSGYGAFSQPGRQRQVHHGHFHCRHHGQHATHHIQDIQDHNMVENVNNTNYEERQDNDQTNHKVQRVSYGLGKHAGPGHIHMQHDYNRQAHDHYTDSKDMGSNLTHPLLNPSDGYSHHSWSVGSWLTGLWYGGPVEELTQIGQDGALQGPREHLVETPWKY